ncbi:hypothetical protein BC941DRAFT_415283 [Chlamydoabsidia padenii]|nr:hypothetical protein BC941DRAFT_415283 [Chlamydoabsidia padenii]
MTSSNYHDLNSNKWSGTAYQEKAGNTYSFMPSHLDHWPLSYDNKTTAAPAVGSTFQSINNNTSPVISTPYLDSSVDDILSPACFSPYTTLSPHLNNMQHQQTTDISVGQYINQDHSIKQEPIFTGDPLELLIDKSKAMNGSPSCSSSEHISTPLFMPILLHNDQQQQMDNGQPLMMGQESTDWPYCNDSNPLLFHALDGLLDPIPQHDDEQALYPLTSHQPFDQNQPSSSTSTSNTTDNNKPVEEEKGTSNKKRKRTDSQDANSDDNSQERQTSRAKKTSSDQKKYGCPICRRKFSRRYNLNTHIRTHNANRIKEFNCDHCGAGFDRKHDRERHISSVHLGNRSYSCTGCDATFSRRDALVRHRVKSHPAH